MQAYIINACEGCAIDVVRGQFISVIDIEGGQVVDFFAESAQNPNEYISPGVTIPCG